MYKVYKHTSPSGKVYIGITSRKDVRRRWERGEGYIHCAAFYAAIKKYGWDNIQHEILYENLSKEEACCLEIQLINKYQNLGISYNILPGGETGWTGVKRTLPKGVRHHSEETKKKISEANKGKPKPWLKNMPRSEETKKKISEANKGKPGWNTGLKWSAEVREKISKSNTGHKASEETRKKQSEAKKGKSPANKGVPASEETRKKQSEAKKQFFQNHKIIWITNGETNKRVDDSLIANFLQNGWKLGRTKIFKSQ